MLLVKPNYVLLAKNEQFCWLNLTKYFLSSEPESFVS